MAVTSACFECVLPPPHPSPSTWVWALTPRCWYWYEPLMRWRPSKGGGNRCQALKFCSSTPSVVCFLTGTMWSASSPSCHHVSLAILLCTLRLSHDEPPLLLLARHWVPATEMWGWGLPGNEYRVSSGGVTYYIRWWLWLFNLVYIVRIPLND